MAPERFEVEAWCRSTWTRPVYDYVSPFCYRISRWLYGAELQYGDTFMSVKNSPVPLECGRWYRVTIEEVFRDHGAGI